MTIADNDRGQRTDPNDVDAILAMTNTDVDAVIASVENHADTIFTWDYEKGRAATARQAVREGQGLDVERRDRPRLVHRRRSRGDDRASRRRRSSPEQTPLRPRRRAGQPAVQLGRQGVEGSRSGVARLAAQPVPPRRAGRLVATAKIVETVPWIDAKYYASTQVMDEARHVEVFAKYLDTKLR